MAVVPGCVEQRDDAGFSFAFQDAINRAVPVLENLLSGERRAVAADENEGIGKLRARSLREIEDFRDVGEVIARERDDVGLPLIDDAKIIALSFRLEIDQLHLVPRVADGGRDEFQAQRLEPQVNLGIHEAARMDSEDLHNAVSDWFLPAPEGAVRTSQSATHFSGGRKREASKSDQRSKRVCETAL